MGPARPAVDDGAADGRACGDSGNFFTAGDRGEDEIPTSGAVENPGGNNVP
jgi:hypothetical protein